MPEQITSITRTSQSPKDFCTLKSDSLISSWFLNKYKTFAPNDFAMMLLAIET